MKHCQNRDQSNGLVQLPLHHQSAFSICDIFCGNRKQALIKHFFDFTRFVMIKKLRSVIWCLTLLLYISKRARGHYVCQESLREYRLFPYGRTSYLNLSFLGFLVVAQQYGRKIGMQNCSGFYDGLFHNIVVSKNNNLFVQHCVKSVQIRSFFWSVFSRIRTEYGEIHEVSLRIQSECGKIRTSKNSIFGHFSRSENYVPV